MYNFKNNYKTSRWSTAWKICIHSNDGSHWNQFAMAALLDSDVGMGKT